MKRVFSKGEIPERKKKSDFLYFCIRLFLQRSRCLFTVVFISMENPWSGVMMVFRSTSMHLPIMENICGMFCRRWWRSIIFPFLCGICISDTVPISLRHFIIMWSAIRWPYCPFLYRKRIQRSYMSSWSFSVFICRVSHSVFTVFTAKIPNRPHSLEALFIFLQGGPFMRPWSIHIFPIPWSICRWSLWELKRFTKRKATPFYLCDGCSGNV